MPLFEFACDRCETQFEELVRRDETVQCPQCGTANPRKLISAPAAHIAGGSLPIMNGCPPSDAPPCNPNCCWL